MFKKLWLFAICYSILCGTVALASDLTSPDLIVKKSFKQSLAESIGSVQIISSDQIQETAATSLVDILKLVPGISTYRKGGDGSLSQIRIRGFEDEQVLIYLDGVIVNDVYFGTHRLEFIDIGNIKQIEIVQGASAMAYGAGAAAGVVSITTNTGGQSNNSISGTLGAGTQNSYRQSASIDHELNRHVAFALSANHFETDGYDVRSDIDPDIDASEKTSFASAVTAQIAQTQLKVSHSEQDGSLMIDGDSASQNDIDHTLKNTSIRVGSSFNFVDLELTHGVSETDEIAYDATNTSNRNVYHTHANNTSVFLSSGSIANGRKYTVGFDHSRSEREASYGASGPYYNFAENSGFIYSQETVISTPFSDRIATTLRHDANKDWGNHNSVVIVSSVSDDVSKTLLSVASNFRAPTFADYAAERGERTNQIQIDHSRLWGDSLLNLSVTKARTPNKMLQGNSTGGQPGGENRINFAEVGINTFAWGTDLKLSYAYTDSRLKEKNWTRMPFVPDHVFRLGGAIATGHGKTNIEAVSQTGFFTDYFEPANSRQSGFTDVNLSHALQISDSLQVKAQIENLLDRSVQYSFAGTTQQRFELPGRSFMLSLSGQF